jgi:2-amino-4,5-dihydroxy-6-oxo-7-(phosphooxy)heptanoate synthase
LLAMMYPRGPGVKDRPLAETVKHAAALATDLGADIVKLPLSGSVAEMRQIVESCPLPVVTAGGSQVSDAEFNQFIADVMKSGARGIAAGRNVFLAADPGAKVREVRRTLQANFAGARPQLALAVAAGG